jgi:branched-chain amino acid transport system ATP-binding protein
LLKVDCIDCYYGENKALHGVSFQISKGEISTIVGNNGAGKTTVLKSIAGLVKPKIGSILFKDTCIDGLAAFQIVGFGISLVPEGRGVFPRMTVQENLEMGSHIPSVRKHRETYMKQVYGYFPVLLERKGQLAGTLSGGEQQMLAIGRGLMSNPDLFMLDEPSLGLSPLMVQEIFSIIKEIYRKGKTILLVEQNTHLALNISDRAYVLENGQIVLEGSGKDLLINDKVKKAYLGF